MHPHQIIGFCILENRLVLSTSEVLENGIKSYVEGTVFF